MSRDRCTNRWVELAKCGAKNLHTDFTCRDCDCPTECRESELLSMFTNHTAKLAPAFASPLIAAYSQTPHGHASATSFPWQEDVGHRTGGAHTGGERNAGVVAGWLRALERSFGSSVRLIPAGGEAKISGGGTVCRALDELCGRRPSCGQTHRAMHAATLESGCVQQARCPLGFLLVCVPIRAKENWLGQIEFGPVGVEQMDPAEVERGLNRLGLPVTARQNLHAPLRALRAIRLEDIEGVIVLLQRVAAVIADELNRASARVTVQEPAAVTAGRRFAELHIGDKITLVDVSRHVALSPDHFSRLFRRATGVSFGEYVNRCRMENAQRLLLDSSQRVTEISFACGFDSVPHFNRVFRRVTGTSPTLFRRRIWSLLGE